MKKALALVLVTLMLLTAIPFSASAALPSSLSGEITENTNYSASEAVGSAVISVTGDLVIKRGVIVTIGAGVVLQINAGCTLTVNGTINNYGQIITKVNSNGSVGSIVNKGNIANLGETSGVIKHEVLFPEVKSDLKSKYKVYLCSEPKRYDEEKYFDNGEDFEAESTHTYWLDITSGKTETYNDGTTVYFSIVFSAMSVDPYKFEVTDGASVLTRDAGVYVMTVADSCVINYGRYDEDALVKIIEIKLPSGDGYRVTGHGTSLEQAEQDMIDSAYVKYGDTFRFKLGIKDGYQESNTTVTIGGSDPSTGAREDISGPDEYGYYTIKNVNDETAAAGGYEINVAGVVSDDMQDLLKGIFNFIQQIFQTIKDIFSSFIELFDFGSDE